MTVRPTDDAQIRAALSAIFPDANVFDVNIGRHTTDVTIAADSDGVSLKFADMPRIAEALGTEHLDFCAQAGSDVLDSWTFDGCVLFIVATYPEAP